MVCELRRLLIAACLVAAFVAPAQATLLSSLFGSGHAPIYDSLPGDVTPHPAVARIIVPEDGSTAFGSGTLVIVALHQKFEQTQCVGCEFVGHALGRPEPFELVPCAS